MTNPNVVCDIIMACSVLNNYCRDRNIDVNILPVTGVLHEHFLELVP